MFTLRGDSSSSSSSSRVRLDCVKASEQCLKEYSCSTKYRTMRQCVAGRESNFSAVTGPEAQGECRNAIDAMKQSPLYNCRCRRGMKKEKNCLRIFWSIFQSLQGMHWPRPTYESLFDRLIRSIYSWKCAFMTVGENIQVFYYEKISNHCAEI